MPTIAQLNAFGLATLDDLDYRFVAIFTLALYVLGSLIVLCHSRKWPDLRESLSSILGIISVFSGVAIFCVFDLTKPPAIDRLSDDSRLAIGLICGVVLAILGMGEVWSVFFVRKRPATAASAPAAPPPAAPPPP